MATPFCDDCIKLVKHEGTAVGTIETIAGVPTYVSKPAGEYAKHKAVIIITDIFGMPFLNNKLLADGFAENGFQTYMPDIFDNDPAPENFPAGWSLQAWFAKHPDDKTWPPLRAVLKALKEQGITTFGATGYCFGAKNVVELAIEGEIAAGAIAHPARLELPTDLERLAASGSKAKILINSCEFDSSFASEAQAKADELLGDGKYQAGYKRAHWEGCSHGFAVRGNMSNPKIKAGKEGAFKATVELFQSALA